MDKLGQVILEHIICIDKLLDISSFSNRSLDEWFCPLVEDMTPEGAVPYLLDGKRERYRASPLASVIISMNMANLLPEMAIDRMLDELLLLRDHAASGDKEKTSKEKKEEDLAGWSLLEGVSVWSTSLAIIALLTNNRIGKTKAQEYKKSVLWLAEQQKPGENGWGYQQWDNCNQNVIMTALALRALAVSYKCQEEFDFSEHEKRVLVDSITKGFLFLKEQMISSKGLVYWMFAERPHCAATTWALLALKEISEISIKDEIEQFYNSNVSKGIDFVISEMPSQAQKWGDEQIVREAGAKYSKQKNYFSFSATLLLELFEIGMTPYHPKVINQIRWLLNNEDEWKIEEYDKGWKCSFTYAMVLSTIVKWSVLVGKENAYALTSNYSNKRLPVVEKLYGMPVMKEQRIQILYKPYVYRNFASGLVSVAAIVFIFCIWKYIIRFVTWGAMLLGRSKEDILIGVIGSLIAAAGLAFITCIGRLVVNHIRRWKR